MNIHELNTKTPAGTDYLAFDDGTDTYKAQAQDILSGADLADNTVTFETKDTTGWPTNEYAFDFLRSGLSLSNLLKIISGAIRNVRYLLNRVGNGAISNVGSNVAGAIGNTALGTTANTISGAIAEHESDISSVNEKIGDTAMGTTATTLTGAIAEHESDISTLNSKTSGEGASSNQYGECNYSWVAKAGIVTVYFTYTPSQNITSSSGALFISNAPLPAVNVYGATADPEASGTVLGSVQLRPDRTIYFNGPRTANHVYRGSVTYVAN